MVNKYLKYGVVVVTFFIAGSAFAAKNITDFDSTQPRGFGGPQDQIHPDACLQGPVYNDQGQNLCPMEDGMYSPQWHAYTDSGMEDYFEDWKGMMMGNAARDPAFFATLSVANQDVINLLNSSALACYPDYVAMSCENDPACPPACADVQTSLYSLLVDPNGMGYVTPAFVLEHIGLDQDIYVDLAQYPYVLQPEDLLPVTADICLRCHFTAGWLEGRSEPQSNAFPYLKGQFWGSEFIEYPGWPGEPQLVNIHEDSEADMEGIQCGFCHRAYDNYKRDSRYDGSTMANGSGGYFVDRYDPFEMGEVHTVYDFQDESVFCGTCHDVTNPLIHTKNSQAPTNMLHPIERTFTEWYWSGYNNTRNRTECWDCHEPMEFPGAQTWMIYPGLERLWGAVDKVWSQPPYDYVNISPTRTQAYMKARSRSERLMRGAGTIEIVSANVVDGLATVEVKVTNNTGHKLPTGFAEGRQMWIHLTAKDANGNVVYEDGAMNSMGELVKTHQTKVYEQLVLAKGYDAFNLPLNNMAAWNILDNTSGDPAAGDLVYTPDGYVSHFDKEFHFVLMNYTEKDNRIPPMGYNKAAYTADGAFIVPYDMNQNDYADGQNWDVTTYTFPVSGELSSLTAELKYQTFNKLYVDFLAEMDREKTEDFGGRARNIPCSDRNMYDGSNEFCGYDTWGDVLQNIWMEANQGDPVLMASTSATIGVGGGVTPPPPIDQCSVYTDKDSCEDSPLECDWKRNLQMCVPD